MLNYCILIHGVVNCVSENCLYYSFFYLLPEVEWCCLNDGLHPLKGSLNTELLLLLSQLKRSLHVNIEQFVN